MIRVVVNRVLLRTLKKSTVRLSRTSRYGTRDRAGVNTDDRVLNKKPVLFRNLFRVMRQRALQLFLHCMLLFHSY